VKVGGRTLNEMREDMGEDPYDTTKYPEADEPLVYTQQGVMTLRNALDAGAAASQQAVQEANQPPDDGGGSTPPPKNGKPNGSPKPSNGSNGKKPETLPAKKALQDLLEEHGFVKREAPRLDPTYRTPKLDQAKVAIQSVVSRVFMRQKERAMQAAGELKKKLLTTKVRKEDPYHEPAGSPEGGEFASSPGGSSYSPKIKSAAKAYAATESGAKKISQASADLIHGRVSSESLTNQKYAQSLVKAVQGAPESDQGELYRGLAFADEEGWPEKFKDQGWKDRKTFQEILDKTKPGDEISLDRISSFTQDRALSAGYGSTGENGNRYELRIMGLRKAVSIDSLSGLDQKEWITQGKFKVVSISNNESVDIPASYADRYHSAGLTLIHKVITIQQVGVF